jgi:hypothetical protein
MLTPGSALYYYIVIYQRQLQKSNLASFTADMRASVGKRKRNESNRFTPEELRDCFTLKKNCISDTRDKIGLKWPNYGKMINIFQSLFNSLTVKLKFPFYPCFSHFCFFNNRRTIIATGTKLYGCSTYKIGKESNRTVFCSSCIQRS